MSSSKMKNSWYRNFYGRIGKDAAVKELMKFGPVLVLKELRHPWEREPFWAPFLFGVSFPKSLSYDLGANPCVYVPDPICIGRIRSVDRYGRNESSQDNDHLNESWIDVIRDYYGTHFISNSSSSGRGRSVDCSIYLENEKEFKKKRGDISDVYCRGKIDEIIRLSETEVDDSLRIEDLEEDLNSYFNELQEHKTDPELLRKLFRILSKNEGDYEWDWGREERQFIPENMRKFQDKIARKKALIEVTEAVLKSQELWGYFIPKSKSVVEIHINYEKIEATCEQKGFPAGRKHFLCYVIAHELYHAWHYADVMSTSGRWGAHGLGLLEENATIETLAEYTRVRPGKRLQ